MDWKELQALDKKAKAVGYRNFLDACRSVIGLGFGEMVKADIDKVLRHLDEHDARQPEEAT